jgi:hypothetical protein
MMLNKTRIALMFVAGIIVPVVSAVQDNSSGGTPNLDLTTPPMISFDGLSEPSSAQYNATELKIPSSITKYELLTFDIPKMREMLAKNETITVRIKGVPYKMNLYDSTGKAIGLDPAIRSYRGSLENVQNSEVHITIDNQGATGRIFITGTNYFFDSRTKTENGKILHYVYSSLDVISVGQPTYWADDYLAYKNSTLTFTEVPSIIQLQTIPKKASLSPLISLVVLGLIVLGILIRR